ncbi:hypothetical protein QJ854_gp858 [Moumouvirus goulette]|uniref:Uncharacterized protein n=1 Tax=Moumouvirus goulette TaxID=1247379 RepID=M1PAR6_9VIRU|nr:hypothetical protein QJ854_gp858 [Moumouvirus goulette]AGF84924.1 hypothetical protein glt_00115 [Moumouvirus goulette]
MKSLITNLNLTHDEFDEECFSILADKLFNHSYLLVNGSKWRLIEIEFYLRNKKHPDPYVHCDPDQLLDHTFYFHKFKTGTYKSGTFKGMDITLGSSKCDTYFGILVRSVQRIKTGEMVEGPCNTVNKILSKYNLENIKDLTDYENLDIFNNGHKFHLKFSKNLDKEKIFAGPRIGLSNKFPEWQNKAYRFAIRPHLIKKKKTSLIKL